MALERPMHTTLPRRFYADPDFYRAELERFYFHRWICAGRADQIPNPGDYFTRTLGNESVIVTRDASGEIHALFNVCRHRGTRLCDQPDGHFADRIQCPYHNWTYGVDGRLLEQRIGPQDTDRFDAAACVENRLENHDPFLPRRDRNRRIDRRHIDDLSRRLHAAVDVNRRLRLRRGRRSG